jgi:cytidyltransferase-like protein
MIDKNMTEEKKIKVVAVSGGFDPVHIGHVRMFDEARALGDKLVVILNNDNWLMKKKGYVFMPENERKELLKAFSSVDDVVLTNHLPDDQDPSVCEALRRVRPDIFANGGDRHAHNVPENAVCDEIGCEMIFSTGTGGKVQSSSWLVSGVAGEALCLCGSGQKIKACGLRATPEHLERMTQKEGE